MDRNVGHSRPLLDLLQEHLDFAVLIRLADARKRKQMIIQKSLVVELEVGEERSMVNGRPLGAVYAADEATAQARIRN